MSTKQTEDAKLFDLLAEVRAGSESAFSRLLALYEPLLRKQAKRFFPHDEREAEDAYQEASLALHRAALRYRVREYITFGLYAGMCIENSLRSFYRRVRRSVSVVSVEDEALAEDGELLSTEFVDPVEERERYEELLSVINAELSPYEQKVFMQYVREIPVSEIAESLGKSEKSVRNAISRMLTKLRKKFGR